jgi:hypothetical protein
MAILPAYAIIVEFQTDKTSYIKGDTIRFSGKTDAQHAGKMISVKIYGPDGKFVALMSGRSGPDSVITVNPVDTTIIKYEEKFVQKGIYNVTAIYDEEPNYLGKSTLFDFSPDGSPVVPSAADLLKQKSIPTPPTEPAEKPKETQIPKESPAPTPPPKTEQETIPPIIPKCGPGTVLKDGVCVIAEPEPEPAPEPEVESTTKTHIPGFPDPAKDPQDYIDRYINEPKYREWFDKNFPDQSIYEVLGVPGPKKTHIPGFPDPAKDPQDYIDRYINEPKYREWFDKNFPGQSIYEIMGLEEPQSNPCGEGTHLEGEVCVLDESAGLMSGCLIATATYGTELAPQVQLLRELRQNTLLATNSGTTFLSAFNDAYYTFSPTISDWERQSPVFKELVRVAITPMLSTLSILNYADIDSESEMLGYGIGIILLNVGMYFVAPTILLARLKKFIS